MLAQIIFDEEAKDGQNLLPIAFLRQLIRFYGDSMQALVPRYLEFSMENLTKEQNQFREQMSKAFGRHGLRRRCARRDPGADAGQYGDLHRGVPGVQPVRRRRQGEGGGRRRGAAKGDDLGELKRELNEMRDRLDKLAKTR